MNLRACEIIKVKRDYKKSAARSSLFSQFFSRLFFMGYTRRSHAVPEWDRDWAGLSQFADITRTKCKSFLTVRPCRHELHLLSSLPRSFFPYKVVFLDDGPRKKVKVPACTTPCRVQWLMAWLLFSFFWLTMKQIHTHICTLHTIQVYIYIYGIYFHIVCVANVIADNGQWLRKSHLIKTN